jgi:hypothetical protein
MFTSTSQPPLCAHLLLQLCLAQLFATFHCYFSPFFLNLCFSCTTRARVLRVGEDGGIDELEVRDPFFVSLLLPSPQFQYYSVCVFFLPLLSQVYYFLQVIQPAPEEFEDGLTDQQFVVSVSSGGGCKTSAGCARVTINRSSSGGLFSEGLEMVSKGSRFNGKQGDYVAHAVDVTNGYIKLNAGLSNHAVIRICSGEADWLPSLQVIKLGCCDVGYHGVPFLAKAIRTLPLTTLHLRENVCIGSNFGCLAGSCASSTRTLACFRLLDQPLAHFFRHLAHAACTQA